MSPSRDARNALDALALTFLREPAKKRGPEMIGLFAAAALEQRDRRLLARAEEMVAALQEEPYIPWETLSWVARGLPTYMRALRASYPEPSESPETVD